MRTGDGCELRLDDLDDIERRVEVATFVATLASVNLVVWLTAAALAGALPMPSPIRAALLLSALAMIWFHFLWAWSIAQMWRAPLLVGALVLGIGFAAIPITQIVNLKSELSLAIKAAFMVLALVSAGFGLRAVLDGWRLARSSDATCRLLTTVPYDRFAAAQAFARALGIHPICRWLPNWRRRGMTTLLFVLTTVALALALMGVVYVVIKGLSTDVPVALDLCLAPRTDRKPYSECAFAVSAAIGPLLVVMFALALVAGLRWLARRSARVSLADVSRSDARPPILFLRSFIDDQVRLALPRRPPFRRLLALGEPAPHLDHVLLEEATPTGPVVAIGLPGSPPPFGAARAYFDDHEWRNAVTGLAARAGAIVVVVDDTDGVQWELEHIRHGGFASKTLYLLPPRLSTPTDARRLVARELPDAADALVRVVSAGSSKPDRAWIGWYRTALGGVRILTAAKPVSTSYVCALRSAFAPWSEHALARAPVLADEARRVPRTRSPLVGIAVVLAMLIPIATFAALTMVRNLGASRSAMVRSQIATIAGALDRYYFDMVEYPPQAIGLRALVEPPPGVTGWHGPYVAGDPDFRDPWGRPYIYRKAGGAGGFELLTLGRDGVPGGSGEDADIVLSR